jgi:hypothetical protein
MILRGRAHSILVTVVIAVLCSPVALLGGFEDEAPSFKTLQIPMQPWT